MVFSLFDGSKNFTLTKDLTLDKSLGVKIRNHEDSSHEFSQPHLISLFLQLLNIPEETKKISQPQLVFQFFTKI